ncbi:MAG TPA: hypothetical protein VJZ71_06030 [Phycisphaerae bacterium]|nr:hypothetical protein [Phycisphaerae bacterium]
MNASASKVGDEGVPKGVEVHDPAGIVFAFDPAVNKIGPEHVSHVVFGRKAKGWSIIGAT